MNTGKNVNTFRKTRGVGLPALMASVTCLLMVGGCATPHVVEAVKTSDASLSCAQIESEMKESERFRADAQKEKGMTGTNVAAVLFFWPAMIGTYSNANEAIAAADTRKSHLMGLYRNKKCDELATVKALEDKVAQDKAAAERAAAPAVSAASHTEKRLGDLKEMLDKKLISQEEHDAKRKEILSAL